MKVSTFIASTLLVASSMVAPVSAANLILNPGFESGTGADADSWTEIEGTGDPINVTVTTDRVNSNAHNGSFAAQMSYSNNATPGTGSNAEVQQQTALNSIIPGQLYNYSFFAKRLGEFGPGTVVFAEVIFLDSDGSAGGGVKGSSGLLNVAGLTESYQQFNYNNILAPTDSDAALVALRLAGGAVPSASGTMFADDFILDSVVVPEPSSLSLLAGLGLLGLARRRGEA